MNSHHTCRFNDIVLWCTQSHQWLRKGKDLDYYRVDYLEDLTASSIPDIGMIFLIHVIIRSISDYSLTMMHWMINKYEI